MTLWIILAFTLVAVSCKPQYNVQKSPEAAQNPDSNRQLEASTKEILEKIAQVNEKQGLTKKKSRPYHQFFSYLRSQQDRQDAGFKFSQTPFTNPIFDYVAKQNEESSEEVPAGHYIKRKITHQTIYVPQYNLQEQTIDNVKNIVGSQFGPYQMPYDPYLTRQIAWPLQQYFPIVIKDPLQHFFQALTTMVEYGPQSGSADSCKKHRSDRKLSYHIENNGKGPEITVENADEANPTTVDIEDLKITDSMSLNLRKSRQSPPNRDQVVFDDEVADEEEEAEKSVVDVSHEGNKKMISKDNTGSGIFVHRIKVRKGGVAIAGPGGIATAGSGGTAIVGPNGFAYTQPDSLAIAGSGTKVIAVEPNINLAEIIMDHDKNKTRGEGHVPPRIGKIVAVGPVIYYNRG